MGQIKQTNNFITDEGVVEKKDVIGTAVIVFSAIMIFSLSFLGFLAILYS